MTQQSYNEEEVHELFDVVFKLSAKDINDKLTKVRNRPEIAKRRWFWELLQNAKDSVTKTEKVDVRLQISKTEKGILFIKFSHNGNPFKYEDAKNLIFPYSDKDDDEDSDKSGRFGTGFLATHILSPNIIVKGVFLKEDKPFDFTFTLDRSGSGKAELAKSIDSTWQDFRKKRTENVTYHYDKTKFDTHFVYPLTPETLELAKESIIDFQTSLPFALTFIPKINSVLIENLLTKESVKYTVNQDKSILIAENIRETIIEKEVVNSGNIPKEFVIITCSNGTTDIAVEVFKEQDEISLKSFEKHQPVLFCPFPLIGANEFPFPIVINSELFIPKEERNGIWLGNTKEGLENQKLFEGTIPLFKILTKYISQQKWKGTFGLFKTLKSESNFPDLEVVWFKELIQKSLKEYLLTEPLVDNPYGDRKPANEINFPYNNNENVRENLWSLLHTFNKSCVPQKDEVHFWYNVLWEGTKRISLEVLAKYIASKKNIDTLNSNFDNSTTNTVEWLNELVSLISVNEITLLNDKESAILPNQFGVFKRKDELYLDDDTIDEPLKDIFASIGKLKEGIIDWREELLEKKIFLELPQNKVRGIVGISVLIVENIKDLLRKDSPSNEMQDLFGTLLNWLSDNIELRDKHFKGIKTDTLLYKTTNETKLKQFTEILRKDREGEISVEDLVNISAQKIALLNDPDLEIKMQLGTQAMAEIIKEKEEFEFKKRNGDLFEKQFQQIINSDGRFDIQKVEGEEDFIITHKSNSKQYYIELKSISLSEQSIQMTHKQAKKAYKFPSNYFLCIIPNNGEVIDEYYFQEKAIFDNNIGVKLNDKVSKAILFEASENGISVEFEDALLGQYKKYRYKFSINKSIWGHDNIVTFKNKMIDE